LSTSEPNKRGIEFVVICFEMKREAGGKFIGNPWLLMDNLESSKVGMSWIAVKPNSYKKSDECTKNKFLMYWIRIALLEKSHTVSR